MNLVDKTISLFSPKLGAERAKHRAVEKILNTGKRSYDGATKSRRGDGWTKGGTLNQNTDIQKSLTILRERSIDAYKNNPNVFRAIRTIKNNVVGTGIMPTPIGIDKKLTKSQIEKVKKEWELFIEDCDFDGMFGFYGLQGLSMQTIAMQGEIFVFKQREASARATFKLQILAPHMVDHTKNSYMITKAEGSYIVQGVQFSAKGKKEGYWVYDYNPNNEFVMKLAPVFVPISDIFQVFYKEFPEQVRGIPFGTSALLNMRDLSDYEDAQLMLQKVAACHVAFTTQTINDSGVLNSDSVLEIDHLEPGLIQQLAPGETVTFNNPPVPSSYSEYVSKNQQKNAAGFGITYEQFTGDLGNVNFSSGRMGWIEAQKQIEDWQYNLFIPQFCKPVWKWFIEGLKIKGIINFDCKADWTPQGREMIDPVKEMNGLILELKSGLISWTEACKRRGYNPDLLMEQMKVDKEMFKTAGIDVEWIIQPEAAADPASGDGGLKGTMSAEDLKRTLDAYGVGVRAGTITPTDSDEEYFRSLAKFPEMSKAVIDAWKEDGGFRRPITLAIAKDNSDFQQ